MHCIVFQKVFATLFHCWHSRGNGGVVSRYTKFKTRKYKEEKIMKAMYIECTLLQIQLQSVSRKEFDRLVVTLYTLSSIYPPLYIVSRFEHFLRDGRYIKDIYNVYMSFINMYIYYTNIMALVEIDKIEPGCLIIIFKNVFFFRNEQESRG